MRAVWWAAAVAASSVVVGVVPGPAGAIVPATPEVTVLAPVARVPAPSLSLGAAVLTATNDVVLVHADVSNQVVVSRLRPDGTAAWTYPPPPVSGTVLLALDRDDGVYVAASGDLVALTAGGQVRWHAAVGVQPLEGVAAVTVGSDGFLYTVEYVAPVPGVSPGSSVLRRRDPATGAVLGEHALGVVPLGAEQVTVLANRDGGLVVSIDDTDVSVDWFAPGGAYRGGQVLTRPTDTSLLSRPAVRTDESVVLFAGALCSDVGTSNVITLYASGFRTAAPFGGRLGCVVTQAVRVFATANGQQVATFDTVSKDTLGSITAFADGQAGQYDVPWEYHAPFATGEPQLTTVHGDQLIVVGNDPAACAPPLGGPGCVQGRAEIVDADGNVTARTDLFDAPSHVGTQYYSAVPSRVISGVNGFAVLTSTKDKAVVPPELPGVFQVFGLAASAHATLTTPTRVLETRASDGQVGYSGPKPAAGGATVVIGPLAVPVGTVAVALNVTATEADADGFVTVWPCDAPRPLASNLNVARGATVANLVVAKLAADRTVCAYVHSSMHLLADLQGTYPVGAAVPVSPSRVLETRSAEGQIGYTGPKPDAGRTVVIGPLSGAPVGTAAVVLNVTATEADADGFVTVWPCDAPRPLASNLNVARGATVANLVVAKLAADRTVCAYVHSSMHLLADLQATLPVGSLLPLTPVRILETRQSEGQILYEGATPAAGDVVQVRIPDPLAASAILNVTATGASADGFVTVWACDEPRPLASNLNVVRGGTVANVVIARPSVVDPSVGLTVCLYTKSSTDLVVDLLGVVPLQPLSLQI